MKNFLYPELLSLHSKLNVKQTVRTHSHLHETVIMPDATSTFERDYRNIVDRISWGNVTSNYFYNEVTYCAIQLG